MEKDVSTQEIGGLARVGMILLGFVLYIGMMLFPCFGRAKGEPAQPVMKDPA
jgi:hypothetical protein